MFNEPLHFERVQSNRFNANKSPNTIPYRYEHIYKFFVKNEFCRRKIIVQVKEYSDTHFTIDFYATTSHKAKETVNPQVSLYRYLTKVGRANRIAGTIFAIIKALRQEFPDMSFGFQAAMSFDESQANTTKRFRVYRAALQVVTGSPNQLDPITLLEYPKNSYIFALPNRLLPKRDKIISEYGRIFGKVFESQKSKKLQSEEGNSR